MLLLSEGDKRAKPGNLQKKRNDRSHTNGDSSSFTLLLNFNLQVHAMDEAVSCRTLTAVVRASSGLVRVGIWGAKMAFGQFYL